MARPIAALLGFCVLTCGISFAQPTPQPSTTPSDAPAATAVAAEATDAAVATAPDLDEKEIKTLLREFRKAQATEARALRHRQSMEIREIKSAHATKRREWEKREREARRKFFSENLRGTDRRAYIKDLFARRKAFMTSLDQEMKNKTAAQETKRNDVRDDQRSKMKEFEALVARKKRPPESLWPRPGL